MSSLPSTALAPSSGRGSGMKRGGKIAADALQKTASASVGAIMTSLLMTPLDVVKTRLQSQMNLKRGPSTCPSMPGCKGRWWEFGCKRKDL